MLFYTVEFSISLSRGQISRFLLTNCFRIISNPCDNCVKLCLAFQIFIYSRSFFLEFFDSFFFLSFQFQLFPLHSNLCVFQLYFSSLADFILPNFFVFTYVFNLPLESFLLFQILLLFQMTGLQSESLSPLFPL